MKITIHALKPRNPLVAHARFRRCGSHQPSASSLRQQAGRSLKRELEHINHYP